MKTTNSGFARTALTPGLILLTAGWLSAAAQDAPSSAGAQNQPATTRDEAREKTKDKIEAARDTKKGAREEIRDAREGARDTAREDRQTTRDTREGARDGVHDARVEKRDAVYDAREG